MYVLCTVWRISFDLILQQVQYLVLVLVLEYKNSQHACILEFFIVFSDRHEL